MIYLNQITNNPTANETRTSISAKTAPIISGHSEQGGQREEIEEGTLLIESLFYQNYYSKLKL